MTFPRKTLARQPHLPPFNAIVYTLENVLPVVKFGQGQRPGAEPAARPRTSCRVEALGAATLLRLAGIRSPGTYHSRLGAGPDSRWRDQ
jgi:hypothetical protein